MITSAGAVAALAAVGSYAYSGRGVLADVGGVLAGAGVVLLVSGLLLRAPFLVPWAVGLAGAGYVVARQHQHTADGWAALVGAGLLLSAELAAWSVEDDRRIHQDRALVGRRALVVAGLVAASALVSFVLVGAAAASTSNGLLLTAVGIAAAVAAFAVVLRLVRE